MINTGASPPPEARVTSAPGRQALDDMRRHPAHLYVIAIGNIRAITKLFGDVHVGEQVSQIKEILAALDVVEAEQAAEDLGQLTDTGRAVVDVSDLHPTKTRLALLRDVADGEVWRRANGTSVATGDGTGQVVTTRIAEAERAGWVRPEPLRYGCALWRLTDAGRAVLDSAAEVTS